METKKIVIKKHFGDFNVFRLDAKGWPNYLGKARTLVGAKLIASQKPTIAQKYHWGQCGAGTGMVA
jgi:hypothetical protein